MEVKVKALKQFSSTTYGNVDQDEVFTCDSHYAYQWKEAGLVEIMNEPKQTYETKVIREAPEVGDVPLASGKDSESGVSQAAQASPKKTRKSSGTKKRSS